MRSSASGRGGRRVWTRSASLWGGDFFMARRDATAAPSHAVEVSRSCRGDPASAPNRHARAAGSGAGAACAGGVTLDRKSEEERGALAGPAVEPDRAAVAVHDRGPGQCQALAGATADFLRREER